MCGYDSLGILSSQLNAGESRPWILSGSGLGWLIFAMTEKIVEMLPEILDLVQILAILLSSLSRDKYAMP